MGEDLDLSIGEYYKEVENLEAVVGAASDGTSCTYSEGYKDRQAVFSCLDCTKAESEVTAGFCYACSVNCHKDHEVEMLYTKRGFRCDCGTIPQLLCQLKPEVDERNADNRYNHNFKGLYCSCRLPFPDPSHPELDSAEMIQCIVCEDWFHDVHINTTVPELYEEMVCGECVGKHPFLSFYALPVPPLLNVTENEPDNVPDTEAPAPPSTETQVTNDASAAATIHSSTETPEAPDTTPVTVNTTTSLETPTAPADTPATVTTLRSSDAEKSTASVAPTTTDSKHTPAAEETLAVALGTPNDSMPLEPSPKRKKPNECKLDGWTPPISGSGNRAHFFGEDFREALCRCETCLSHYSDHGVSFLGRPEDSLSAYEQSGAEERVREEERLEGVIQGLPHEARCTVARAMGTLHQGIGEIFSRLSERREEVDADMITDQIRRTFTEMAKSNNIDPKLFENIGKK